MDAQDPIEPPSTPPPVAPPIHAGPIPIARVQSKWPGVLGVIAIVLGAFGMLSLVGAVVVHFLPRPQMAGPQPVSFQPSAAWNGIYMPIRAVLSALLLIGGIGLVNRRNWSGRALLIWGIADTVLTAASMVVGWSSMSSVQQQMQQQNPALSPMAAVPFGVFFGLMMCFGAVIGLTPPIFAVIWFSRRKIKDEVATWA